MMKFSQKNNTGYNIQREEIQLVHALSKAVFAMVKCPGLIPAGVSFGLAPTKEARDMKNGATSIRTSKR
jgi:hypothetical protein